MKKVLILYKDEVPAEGETTETAPAAVPAATATASAVVSSPLQVKDGETVKKGQLLMKFDLDGIKADGYDVTTPIVVTNADEFTIKTVAEGAVVPGAALLKLEANK